MAHQSYPEGHKCQRNRMIGRLNDVQVAELLALPVRNALNQVSKPGNSLPSPSAIISTEIAAMISPIKRVTT